MSGSAADQHEAPKDWGSCGPDLSGLAEALRGALTSVADKVEATLVEHTRILEEERARSAEERTKLAEELKAAADKQEELARQLADERAKFDAELQASTATSDKALEEELAKRLTDERAKVAQQLKAEADKALEEALERRLSEERARLAEEMKSAQAANRAARELTVEDEEKRRKEDEAERKRQEEEKEQQRQWELWSRWHQRRKEKVNAQLVSAIAEFGRLRSAGAVDEATLRRGKGPRQEERAVAPAPVEAVAPALVEAPGAEGPLVAEAVPPATEVASLVAETVAGRPADEELREAEERRVAKEAKEKEKAAEEEAKAREAEEKRKKEAEEQARAAAANAEEQARDAAARAQEEAARKTAELNRLAAAKRQQADGSPSPKSSASNGGADSAAAAAAKALQAAKRDAMELAAKMRPTMPDMMDTGKDVWLVVGGGDAGGIIVRQGKSVQSPEFPMRLQTGSKVEAVEVSGKRLKYRRLRGDGPDIGWVSIEGPGGKTLMVEMDMFDM